MNERKELEYEQFSSDEYMGYDSLINHTYNNPTSEISTPPLDSEVPEMSDKMWANLKRGFDTGYFKEELDSFPVIYKAAQQMAFSRGEEFVDGYFFELEREMYPTIMDYELYNHNKLDTMQDVREANETLAEDFADYAYWNTRESVAWHQNGALRSIYFMFLGASILLLSQLILGVFV